MKSNPPKTGLSEAERIEARRAQQRRYYNANKRRFKDYYKHNKKARQDYDKMYRSLNADAIKLRDKIYNETKRKQRPKQG